MLDPFIFHEKDHFAIKRKESSHPSTHLQNMQNLNWFMLIVCGKIRVVYEGSGRKENERSVGMGNGGGGDRQSPRWWQR